jgi:hypothetical protein
MRLGAHKGWNLVRYPMELPRMMCMRTGVHPIFPTHASSTLLAWCERDFGRRVKDGGGSGGGGWGWVGEKRGRVSAMRSKTLAHDCLIKLTGTTLGRGRWDWALNTHVVMGQILEKYMTSCRKWEFLRDGCLHGQLLKIVELLDAICRHCPLISKRWLGLLPAYIVKEWV